MCTLKGSIPGFVSCHFRQGDASSFDPVVILHLVWMSFEVKPFYKTCCTFLWPLWSWRDATWSCLVTSPFLCTRARNVGPEHVLQSPFIWSLKWSSNLRSTCQHRALESIFKLRLVTIYTVLVLLYSMFVPDKWMTLAREDYSPLTVFSVYWSLGLCHYRKTWGDAQISTSYRQQSFMCTIGPKPHSCEESICGEVVCLICLTFSCARDVIHVVMYDENDRLKNWKQL